MQDLKISFIQAKLFWEDPQRNRDRLGQRLDQLTEETDLIILPEMFNTGFTMNVKAMAEEPDGPTTHWLAQQAQGKSCVVTGSLITCENGRYFNRLIWMRPDGSYQTYDKRHLFTLGEEHKKFTAGQKRLIVPLSGWTICPLVCYDLRFPAWCRNQYDPATNTAEFDCQIFIANWPERRNYAWKQLLIARAIENQAYVVGVNRVGEDGNGIYHSGDSSVIDPLGELIYQKAHDEVVKTFTLSKDRLEIIRNSYPFLGDGDHFEIK